MDSKKCKNFNLNGVELKTDFGKVIEIINCVKRTERCVSFIGRDEESGQLVYLAQWIIRNEELDKKNFKQAEFIRTIKDKISELRNLEHPHLVNYLDIKCVKKEKYIFIFIIQDYIQGIRISKISKHYGPHDTASIAQDILSALSYLEANGQKHGCLSSNSIFVDKNGVTRVSDYVIASFLRGFFENGEQKNDLLALGTVMEELKKSDEIKMQNFIEKCKLEQTTIADMLDLLKNNEDESGHTSFEDENLLQETRFDQDFEFVERLGDGAYGIVVKARNKLDGQMYAIKKTKLSTNEVKSLKTLREIQIHSSLNHDNIIGYKHSWSQKEWHSPSSLPSAYASSQEYSTETATHSEDGVIFSTSVGLEAMKLSDSEESVEKEEYSFLYIKMEPAMTTLRKELGKQILHSQPHRVFNIFAQICAGVDYMHSENVIHRDLKPSNIFLSENYKVKIGDFGQATTLENINKVTSCQNSIKNGTDRVGTFPYVAPELEEGPAYKAKYDTKADIYSLGIILFEMHEPILTDFERVKILTALRRGEISTVKHRSKDMTYNIMIELVQKMINHNSSERPTAKQISLLLRRSEFFIHFNSDIFNIRNNFQWNSVILSNLLPLVDSLESMKKDSVQPITCASSRSSGRTKPFQAMKLLQSKLILGQNNTQFKRSGTQSLTNSACGSLNSKTDVTKWIYVSNLPVKVSKDTLKTFLRDTFGCKDVLCQSLFVMQPNGTLLPYRAFRIGVPKQFVNNILKLKYWPKGVVIKKCNANCISN